jgi:hypothetical protein
MAQMRYSPADILRATALCAGLLAAGGSAVAAGALEQGSRPTLIRGTLNTQSGIFVARPGKAAIEEAEATNLTASTVTGTLSFTYNITLKSGFPDTTAIRCSATASTRDENYSETSIYYDIKSALATRSGSTATCKVSIPYSWLLANPASTMLSMDYTVTAIPASENGVSRHHMGNLATITVPTNGTTTFRTINVTL